MSTTTMTYLAVIELHKVPTDLLPLTPDTIGEMLNLNGWKVTHQAVRDYGHALWVALERDIKVPESKHPACRILAADGSLVVGSP